MKSFVHGLTRPKLWRECRTMWHIRYELPRDMLLIEALLDRVHGSDRHRRPIYRLREGVPPVRHLCFVGECSGEIAATVRFWPVVVGESAPALLMGPVAVDPKLDSDGVEEWFVRHALDRAHATGHKIVLAAAKNSTSYNRLGFNPGCVARFALPYTMIREILIGLELECGALEGLEGTIRRWPLAFPEPKNSPTTSALKPALSGFGEKLRPPVRGGDKTRV